MNPSRPIGRLAVALNLLGAAVVGWSLLASHSAQRPLWVLVVGVLAVLAWAARSVLAAVGAPRTTLVLAVISAIAGAVAAAGTDGVMVVPAVVAILSLVGDETRPLWQGLALGGAVIVVVAAGAVPFGTAVLAVLSMLGGVLLAVFAGLSRRQFRRSETQAAELRERDLAIREEAARVAIARDLHDVLAHSLGGLVIQLDAVDALLEAGESAAARTRVVDARGLAANGLAEARRAVAALRDPAAQERAVVAPADLVSALRDLAAAHRSLGGDASLQVTGAGRPVAGDVAVALQRALQEALSNARKHAPGAPVSVRVDWQTDRVRLTVSTPVVPAHPVLSGSGGGRGLDGMRERFAALEHGGRVTASVVDDLFTVTAEAALR